MIAAAERINQLPEALRIIEADMEVKANEDKRIKPIHPFYPLILIASVIFVVLGLMVFVMPKFEEILYDIGASFPISTKILMSASSFVFFKIGALTWGLMPLIVAMGIILSIKLKFRPRRPDKPYMLSRISDFIKWHLPILHWFETCTRIVV